MLTQPSHPIRASCRTDVPNVWVSYLLRSVVPSTFAPYSLEKAAVSLAEMPYTETPVAIKVGRTNLEKGSRPRNVGRLEARRTVGRRVHLQVDHPLVQPGQQWLVVLLGCGPAPLAELEELLRVIRRVVRWVVGRVTGGSLLSERSRRHCVPAYVCPCNYGRRRRVSSDVPPRCVHTCVCSTAKGNERALENGPQKEKPRPSRLVGDHTA